MLPPLKSIGGAFSFDFYLLAQKPIRKDTHFDVNIDRLQIEQGFHVCQALSQLAIYSTQEVEWNTQLEEKLVNEDQVTKGHCAYRSVNSVVVFI